MISVKLTTRNRIHELRKQLRPRAGRAINAWARAVFDISQQLVPVDSGDLKTSGKVVNYANTRGDGRQRGVAKSVVYDEIYSLLVELGTSTQVAQPYLLPAYEACRAQLLDDLARIAAL